MHIGLTLDPQRHLAILFVGDADIDELHQLAHHLHRGLPVLPQIFAVVEIAGDGQPLLSRFANRLQRQSRRRRAQCRRDACDVEPARALQNRIPIDIAGLGKGDRAIVAVVNHLRGTLVCARFHVVHAHAALGAQDLRSVHAKAAQLRHHGVGDRIVRRQRRDVGRRQSETRQRHRDVGFPAPKSGHELRRLQEALEARRRQAQHDLSECDRRFDHRLSGDRDHVDAEAGVHGGQSLERYHGGRRGARLVEELEADAPHLLADTCG